MVIKQVLMPLTLAALMLAGGVSAASANGQGTLGKQGLSNSQVAGIKQIIDRWTKDLMERKFRSWEKLWAEGGTLMPPDHGPVVGRSNLVSYMRANYSDVKKVRFSNWDVVGRQDLAVVTNELVAEVGSSSTPLRLQQVIVMRLHHNEKWLVQAVIFNRDSDG